MNNLTFLYPGWLLLLPFGVWIAVLFNRGFRRRSMWSSYCDPGLLKLIHNRSIASRANSLSITLSIILSLGVVTLAGPGWQQRDYPLLESSTARVLILDLSRSMLVEDIKPNRFESARHITRQLLAGNFDGETALIVFAGSAFTVSPLTRDATTLLEFIEALTPQTMPEEGNRLDLALAKAAQLLEASITGTGQVLVVTDGINQVGQAKLAASELSRTGNRLSIIAIGSRQGGPLRSEDGSLKQNSSGLYILAKPNLPELETISRLGNGQFLSIEESGPSIGALLDYTSQDTTQQVLALSPESMRLPENGGYWLIWLILPFTLLLFRKNVVWILLIVWLAPAEQTLYAMDWNELWWNDEQRAHSAYLQGNYQLVQQLSNNPLLIGAAYYRQQNHVEADKVFSQQQSAEFLYNRGNALAHLGQLKQALEIYRQALKLNPALDAAQFNHDLIAGFLESNPDIGGEPSGSGDMAIDGEDQQDDYNSASGSGQINQASDRSNEAMQAGVGASSPSSGNDPEQNDLIEEAGIQLEQFLKQTQQADFRPDPQLVKTWTNSLYTDPSELFKRKFLRDHLRNKRKQR